MSYEIVRWVSWIILSQVKFFFFKFFYWKHFIAFVVIEFLGKTFLLFHFLKTVFHFSGNWSCFRSESGRRWTEKTKKLEEKKNSGVFVKIFFLHQFLFRIFCFVFSFKTTGKKNKWKYENGSKWFFTVLLFWSVRLTDFILQ